MKFAYISNGVNPKGNICMTLAQLKESQTAVVSGLDIQGNMRRRLRDLGLADGCTVVCQGVSPLGDPKAYLIKGSLIAIRNSDADKINVICSENIG